MSRTYYVYMLTNKSSTLYVGVTNNLPRRVFEHRNKILKGFTQKYNLDRLIYSEEFSSINEALAREKQIKGWRRSKKMALIKSLNPRFEEISAA